MKIEICSSRQEYSKRPYKTGIQFLMAFPFPEESLSIPCDLIDTMIKEHCNDEQLSDILARDLPLRIYCEIHEKEENSLNGVMVKDTRFALPLYEFKEYVLVHCSVVFQWFDEFSTGIPAYFFISPFSQYEMSKKRLARKP